MITRNATYVKRLTVLRDVIKSIPPRLFALDSVGINMNAEIGEHGEGFTPVQVVHCGTVGCILGWAHTIPAARRWVKENSDSEYGFDPSDDHWNDFALYYGVDGHTFFDARNHCDAGRTDKERALRRIDDAINRRKRK